MRCGRCGHEVQSDVTGWYSTHDVNSGVTGALISTDKNYNCDVDGYPHGPIVPIETDQ